MTQQSFKILWLGLISGVQDGHWNGKWSIVNKRLRKPIKENVWLQKRQNLHWEHCLYCCLVMNGNWALQRLRKQSLFISHRIGYGKSQIWMWIEMALWIDKNDSLVSRLNHLSFHQHKRYNIGALSLVVNEDANKQVVSKLLWESRNNYSDVVFNRFEVKSSWGKTWWSHEMQSPQRLLSESDRTFTRRF